LAVSICGSIEDVVGAGKKKQHGEKIKVPKEREPVKVINLIDAAAAECGTRNVCWRRLEERISNQCRQNLRVYAEFERSADCRARHTTNTFEIGDVTPEAGSIAWSMRAGFRKPAGSQLVRLAATYPESKRLSESTSDCTPDLDS
jgi:hypothetical protein